MTQAAELTTNPVELTSDGLPSEIPAGELVVLKRHLGSSIDDTYYLGELRQDKAQTFGRLSVEARRLSKIRMDLFITDVHITNWGGDRVVGGNGSDKAFSVRYPVDYTNFVPITVLEDDPDYVMDRPKDFPPLLKKEINPVSLIVGRDEVIKRLSAFLVSGLGAIDHEGVEAVRLRVGEVFSNPDSTANDATELFDFANTTTEAAWHRMRARGQL